MNHIEWQLQLEITEHSSVCIPLTAPSCLGRGSYNGGQLEVDVKTKLGGYEFNAATTTTTNRRNRKLYMVTIVKSCKNPQMKISRFFLCLKSLAYVLISNIGECPSGGSLL